MGRPARFAALLFAVLAFAGALHLGAHLTSELDQSCVQCLSPACFELPCAAALGLFDAPRLGEVAPPPAAPPVVVRLGPRFGRAPPS
ncbi:MAG: hypothetical protein ISR76_04350 [Planctomycetes bacterium]|nr:hypothetical protein [Planctomycetota bacterium]MBL7008205.1 hypothetical protein [Planctomycetota bacterium]